MTELNVDWEKWRKWLNWLLLVVAYFASTVYCGIKAANALSYYAQMEGRYSWQLVKNGVLEQELELTKKELARCASEKH